MVDQHAGDTILKPGGVTVTNHYPQGQDVPVNTTISVTFSVDMDHTTTENAFSILPNVNGVFSWNGKTLIYTPYQYVSGNTTYKVTINTNATSTSGEHLQTPHTWEFKTQKPKVTLSSPVGGEVWSGGSTQQIIWWIYNANLPLTVTLYYSTDSGVSYPNEIVKLSNYSSGQFVY
jgi:hypothetical protein